MQAQCFAWQVSVVRKGQAIEALTAVTVAMFAVIAYTVLISTPTA